MFYTKCNIEAASQLSVEELDCSIFFFSSVKLNFIETNMVNVCMRRSFIAVTVSSLLPKLRLIMMYNSINSINVLGSWFKSINQSGCSTKLFFSTRRGVKPSPSGRSLSVQARYNDGGRSSNGGFFVGGFVLGGLIVGALGCVYAPQISKAISGTDKEEIMRKLPKFLYDEEKALEKQRKILAKKIEQINSSIDGISAQLRSQDAKDGADANPDEVEALL